MAMLENTLEEEKRAREKIDKENTTNQIIITNLCHVLGALNTNCPFRRPLIGELSIGLLNNEVQHIFKISRTTVSRGH